LRPFETPLKPVPLDNEPVYQHGAIITKIISAARGERIGKPIELACLDQKLARERADAEVDVAGIRWRGKVSLKPAFDPNGSRMRA